MIAPCPFCSKNGTFNAEASFTNTYVYNCNGCVGNVIVEFTIPNNLVNYIAIYDEHYMLDMDLTGKSTGFFDLTKPKDNEFCFRLNQLVDVTPTTFRLWVDRMLKTILLS